jgi:hypothetical protein
MEQGINELKEQRKIISDKIQDLNSEYRKINKNIDDFYFNAYRIEDIKDHLVLIRKGKITYLIFVNNVEKMTHGAKLTGETVIYYEGCCDFDSSYIYNIIRENYPNITIVDELIFDFRDIQNAVAVLRSKI